MKFIPLLFLTSSLQAGTIYYVDPVSGNDTNNGTSTSTAWQHLPDSVGFSGSGWFPLTTGDTLLVKGGSTNSYQAKLSPTYYQGTTNYDSVLIQSGHLANPPWGSGQAIIDGGSNRTYGIWFSGNAGGSLKGLTFDGFEVREIKDGAVGPGFDTSTGSCCLAVGGNYATKFLKIMRCWLHHAYPGSGDDKGHGIECSHVSDFIFTQNHVGPYIGTKGIEPSGSSFGVISNNFFSGCADHCISLANATNIDACYNTIFNMPIPVMKHEPQYGIAISRGNHCDVYDNLIYRSITVTNTGTEDWPMGLGSYTSDSTNRIFFNTIAFFGDFGSGGNSTAMRMGDGSYTSGYTNFGTIIQNNIVVSNFNVSGKLQYIVRTNTVRNEDVQYNCFFGTNITAVAMTFSKDDPGPPVYTHFTVANFNPDVGIYTNNVQLSPLFVGGTLPDGVTANYLPNQPFFDLTALTPLPILITPNRPQGGPGFGYNTNANKFDLDILGRRRSNWSMGAYEWSPLVRMELR